MPESDFVSSPRPQGFASASIFPLVYEELRQLAQLRLAGEAAGNTLQPTALVHEAYLKLSVEDEAPDRWKNRGHFLAAAAEAMRWILIDRARRRRSLKRGGDRQRVDLVEGCASAETSYEELMAVDEALCQLAEHDAVKAQLVKLRFYAGLTLKEAAEACEISLATAERHWAFAKTWLYARLQHDSDG